MPVVGERKYLLTALSGKTIADLICCTDMLDYSFITETLRKRSIGYEVISELDAIKLLIQDECLAFGCYLTSGDTGLDEFAALKAKALYLGLSNDIGIVRESEPVALSITMLPIKPSLVTHS